MASVEAWTNSTPYLDLMMVGKPSNPSLEKFRLCFKWTFIWNKMKVYWKLIIINCIKIFTLLYKCSRIIRVPNWVCIYIPGYVYIPFPEFGYVKGMYFPKKVCNTENFGEVTIKWFRMIWMDCCSNLSLELTLAIVASVQNGGWNQHSMLYLYNVRIIFCY